MKHSIADAGLQDWKRAQMPNAAKASQLKREKIVAHLKKRLAKIEENDESAPEGLAMVPADSRDLALSEKMSRLVQYRLGSEIKGRLEHRLWGQYIDKGIRYAYEFAEKRVLGVGAQVVKAGAKGLVSPAFFLSEISGAILTQSTYEPVGRQYFYTPESILLQSPECQYAIVSKKRHIRRDLIERLETGDDLLGHFSLDAICAITKDNPDVKEALYERIEHLESDHDEMLLNLFESNESVSRSEKNRFRSVPALQSSTKVSQPRRRPAVAQ